MDPRFLHLYNRELGHLRESAAEFAAENPGVAKRLGLDEKRAEVCADPYVERLLEGFGFLAARVQLEIERQLPRLTQHLLEVVYPQYLAPTPSMAVVRLEPDPSQSPLVEGVRVPRGSVLRGLKRRGEATACEYRTGHEVRLWPIEIGMASYHASTREALELHVPERLGARAALRLRLRALHGGPIAELAIDNLPMFLWGADDRPARLFEQLAGNTKAIVAQPPSIKEKPPAWQHVIDESPVQLSGFAESEALLPPFGFDPDGVQRLRPRRHGAFHGYRLLREYFAFPERFRSVILAGLLPALRRCNESEIDLIVALNRVDPLLAKGIEARQFVLFCTPAINLFPKRTDRIQLDERSHEHLIVPDRTRPMDFEVYDVVRVVGVGQSKDDEQPFSPLYALDDVHAGSQGRAFYTVQRTQRRLSERQKRQGPRSSYLGSEMWISLVDTANAPYRSTLKQLSIETLCTNRDLALYLPVDEGFTMEAGEPVKHVEVVAGPTRPYPPHTQGELSWRLISHLGVNFLSLLSDPETGGPNGLKTLLALYADLGDPASRKVVEDGVVSVNAHEIFERVPRSGPIAFARGRGIDLRLDESAFEGKSGAFLLGLVLEQFFRRYVSINSFTRTTLSTQQRGEVQRWPARFGLRPIL